jgi:hypothetical protein
MGLATPGANPHGFAPMRRTSIAALLAAPLLLAIPSFSLANPPGPCFTHFGCGGGCISLFSKLHQHGPLFNYGPYYGYPPFEPYGPWNAYLQYNPWYYGTGNGGGGRGGHGGHCGHCGWHAPWKQGGWFANCGHIREGLPGWFQGKHCHHCGKAAPCNTCGGGAAAATGCGAQPAAPTAPASNPMTRISGIGSAGDSAVFYAGLPSLDPEATSVVHAGR